MTICMVCGRKDCSDHYGYSYPIALIEKLFGNQEEYSAELEALHPVKVRDRVRNVYGRDFVFQPQGIRLSAEYVDGRFFVNFADPRLMSKGVRFFYPNGTAVQAIEEQSQIRQPQQTHSITTPDPICPNNDTSHIDLIERFGGREERGLHYLIAPERYINGGSGLICELCEALINYLPSDNTREIKNIQIRFERGRICYETAIAVLVSFFPHADEQGYAIPLAKPDIVLVDKSGGGLCTYLKTAVHNLYPNLILNRQLQELLDAKLFGIFTKNVFKKSEQEVSKEYDWI